MVSGFETLTLLRIVYGFLTTYSNLTFVMLVYATVISAPIAPLTVPGESDPSSVFDFLYDE